MGYTTSAVVGLGLCLAIAMPAAAAAPVSSGAPATPYYLALGDSLSVGFQTTGPAADDHRTDQGYPDQLLILAREWIPGLQLVKLGCPGESTATMSEPNPRCPQPHGSQLAEALAFIEAHPADLAFITIDIGFGDFPCDTGTECVAPGLKSIQDNLPGIMSALRAAAPDTPIVGMTIYDPFLGAWLTGDEGLARISVPVIGAINTTLSNIFGAAGVKVADVEGMFQTADFDTAVTIPWLGPLPRNVTLICLWSWMCAAEPYGPDRHANAAGHQAIAQAFAAQLRP